MKYYLPILFISLLLSCNRTIKQKETITTVQKEITAPSRTEIVSPLHKTSFDTNINGSCKVRKQGGNPRIESGYFSFDGSMDGNRQVDPQIAVGGGYILHGTNNGLIIYDKEGTYITGVSQNCFNKGIDPKLFFDPHNKVFGFDLWNPWDKEKNKPINISISETSNPTGAWNTYPVSAKGGVDGGGISYSKKWIGYTFPGGEEQSLVLKMSEAKAGKPATIFHFPKNLGHPIAIQDPIDALYFFKITDTHFIINKIITAENDTPVCELLSKKEHGLEFVNYPPQSPQKGTSQLTSSGDRNPKNLVFQNGHIWFSQTVNHQGNAAVQWHQISLDGTIIQTGIISDKNTNYIQTTIAVNKNNDVLIGFQETNKSMFISPRFTFRNNTDPLGTTQDIVSIGEGKGATSGTSWGDYSGSCIDGDNLLDLWTIQSITDKDGKGDTVITKVPFNN